MHRKSILVTFMLVIKNTELVFEKRGWASSNHILVQPKWGLRRQSNSAFLPILNLDMDPILGIYHNDIKSSIALKRAIYLKISSIWIKNRPDCDRKNALS